MYKIILPNFEGPLDLLLYFIKRDEVNIYDIPIAKITEEFLKYIRIMKLFDLELAGEFLVMATTLMYIKTQMLLPASESESDQEIEDPRTQLVERLIEYRLFKSAAKELSDYAENSRYSYYRNLFDNENKLANELAEENYQNSTIFDLLRAFRKALERTQKKESEHLVSLENITIEEQKVHLLSQLRSKNSISFFEFTKSASRMHLVVTFLAVLDLIKMKIIIILQSDLFDDITILKTENEVL